ncbi:MAG: hypothetical protein KKF20_03780, partial [Bacteroidetes bacterium]|nr:hypothetical protein [Bacteroidota bacterium]
ESEKIKRINSRTSYLGAWSGLIVSGIVLAGLIVKTWGNLSNQEFSLVPILITIMMLTVLIQSFFLIIRHLTNKRLIIILEALLDDK